MHLYSIISILTIVCLHVALAAKNTSVKSNRVRKGKREPNCNKNESRNMINNKLLHLQSLLQADLKNATSFGDTRLCKNWGYTELKVTLPKKDKDICNEEKMTSEMHKWVQGFEFAMGFLHAIGTKYFSDTHKLLVPNFKGINDSLTALHEYVKILQNCLKRAKKGDNYKSKIPPDIENQTEGRSLALQILSHANCSVGQLNIWFQSLTKPCLAAEIRNFFRNTNCCIKCESLLAKRGSGKRTGCSTGKNKTKTKPRANRKPKKN